MTMVTRINALLAEKGISKTEFYERCHISSGAFSQWNTGKVAPSRKSVELMAEFLNTSTEYLLTGRGQKEKPAPVSGDGLTNAQREAIALFDSLSKDGQETMLALARALQEQEDRKRNG